MKRLVCVFSFMVKINKKIAPVELQPICYWMPRDRNTLYLVCPTVSLVQCVIRYCRKYHYTFANTTSISTDMTWTFFWMSSKLSKVISSFCKHSAASRHFPLLPHSFQAFQGSSFYVQPSSFTVLTRLWSHKCLCLRNPVGKISSLEEFSVLFGTDWCRKVPCFDLSSSVNRMLKAWYREWQSSAPFRPVSVKVLSHTASWEQLFYPLSCGPILQWLSSRFTYAVLTKIYLSGGYTWSAWSMKCSVNMSVLFSHYALGKK